jgi:hypothetical protein
MVHDLVLAARMCHDQGSAEAAFRGMACAGRERAAKGVSPMNSTKSEPPPADAAPGVGPTAPSPAHLHGPEPTLVLAPLLAIATIIAISLPGWTSIASQLCIVGWISLTIVWVITLGRRIAHRHDARHVARPFWTVVVLPGFLAMLVVLAATDIPIRARFQLSRDEMTGAANAVLQAAATTPPSRIGSLPIQSIETNGVTVSFLTSGFGSSNRWGFLYAPHGLAGTGGLTLDDIGDNWYIFHEGSGFPPL